MTGVVCVGDVMVDVLAQLPGELAVGSDTPAPISLLGGGSAANTAAWLARAGVETTFVGRVGDDVLGRMAIEELARAGVTVAVSVDPARPTGTCIVLVDATGERTMVPAAGANSGLNEAALPDELLSVGTRLHISAYAVFNPGSKDAVDTLVARAGAAQVPVSIDAASSAPLRDFGPDRFLHWLPEGALLFANLDEARVLAGPGAAQDLARSLGSRTGATIVKCGADGAVWSDGTSVASATTEPVIPIDSTGAGDAFAAGVLSQLMRGEGIEAALSEGNRLAATAITRAGARP